MGNAVVYQNLAEKIDSHAVYSFDYINSDDKLDLYTNYIRTIQPEGPYLLMGYSAGGNLAFEVARHLESKQFVVSDVIMISSIKRNFIYSNEEISKLLEYNSIKQNVTNLLLRYKVTSQPDLVIDKLVKDAQNYSHYI
jgi:thioesterase domain-containing protein